MDKDDKKQEAYPQPSTEDKQYNNQTEYIDQQPNDFKDKSISNVPASNADRQSNDPQQELKEQN